MGGQTGGTTAPAPPGMMQPGGMMGGMCPMMGGSMGGMIGMGMMTPGLMAGGQDPKMMGRMLQMRADMMRSMADVLARHGKALEESREGATLGSYRAAARGLIRL
ncbi:MAG: hypothetical protein ACREMB_05150 [Candidatus Rokuibacteriota bacterium]